MSEDGKRKRAPGGGRKPLPPDKRKVHCTIRLSPDEAYLCEIMGKGNLSKGARMIISEAFRRLKPDKEYDSLNNSLE